MINVLIVDDDEELLFMMGLMIKSHHMKATCIGMGAEILPSLETAQFDLILMDIFLGGDDGRHLTRRFKTDDRYSHIPILLYSAGNIETASIRESLADDFIQKPFEMPVLIEKIRGLVKDRML